MNKFSYLPVFSSCHSDDSCNPYLNNYTIQTNGSFNRMESMVFILANDPHFKWAYLRQKALFPTAFY